MADVTVTNSAFTALNTITTVTKNAASTDVDNTAQNFVITPTKAGKMLVIIIGGTGSGADGNLTYSISAGDLWASKAITGTVTKNTEKMLRVDTAQVLQDDGTIVVSLAPASTDKLLTDHAAYVKVIEML